MNDELPSIRTTLPGPRSRDHTARQKEVESHAVSTVLKGADPIVWQRGQGSLIEDVDGNTFLDCTSAFGAAALGYSHPAVVQAVSLQAQTLQHAMVAAQPHAIYASTLESIARRVGRFPNSRVALTSSGAEAVEVALKSAYRHTGAPGFIAFHGSFHGQSLGALAVTGHDSLRTPLNPLVCSHATFVPYPNPLKSGAAEQSIQAIRKEIEQSDACPIGAVLIEPVQNPAGYIVPPDGFLKELRRLCTEKGILLIADEIFTGFGRTGEWLALDHDNVVPDIVCVGKSMTGGLPCAACVASEAITESMLDTSSFLPLHGSTFMANPLSCAAIMATIDVLDSQGLIERARSMGLHIRNELARVCQGIQCIREVRGRGLAIAIEFCSSSHRDAREIAFSVIDEMLRRGLVFLITGLPSLNVVAVCPPLVSTDSQVDFMLAQWKSLLADL